MPKFTKSLRIDIQSPSDVAGVAEDTIDDPAPPAITGVDPPTGLILATLLSRSATTPMAIVNATWTPPDGYDTSTQQNALSYLIQWSTSATFATNVNGQAALQASAAIDNLTTNTLYYFRVAAVYRGVQSPYSATASITTAVDTVPPNPPSGQSASFAGIGDLVIVWTNPTSENFREVEIKIYSSAAMTTLYATLNDATGRRRWSAAENLAATSQVGDPSLYVVLRSLSWGGIFSTSVNTGTITKAVPATPTGLTSSWASDTGAAGPDCAITWTAQTDAAYYSLTIDSLARTLFAPRLVYTLDQNRSEHSGTPDPVLTLGLVAVDGLKQASASAPLTATNAAPAAPVVTLIGGFSQLVAQVTSTPPADFLRYEYAWKRDGATVNTNESASSEQQYATGAAGDEGTHSWTVTVRQKDQFNQFSAADVSSAVILDTLTIAYLRAGLVYTDSVGNSQAILAPLKDGDPITGVPYGA